MCFFNPGPERRVQSPNRYIADAKLCFCKNNKRMMMGLGFRVYGLGLRVEGSAGGVEHFHGISERGPEILKTAIKDVFKRVTIMIIHFHPGSFFSIIDGKFSRSNESVSECAACEKPTKLNAEEQKEAVDVTGKVFVRLDRAACPCRVVGRRKFGSAPLTFAALVFTCRNEARTRSGTTQTFRAAGASSSWSDMSLLLRPKPGRSTPAPLRVRVKVRLSE
jgi:hypothetical protein